MFNLFTSKKTDQSDRQASFFVEPLEERMMLSTVQIFAAGSTGEESFRLTAGNETAVFENVGGNAANGNFQTFTFETNQNLSASDIDIEFFNDSFDSATGRDRNLTVNRIEVDGQTFFTARDDVYSEGGFQFGNQANGYGVGDTLYLNGRFEFGSNVNDGTEITVFARGANGDERFEVLVGDEVIGTAQVRDLPFDDFGDFTVGVNRDVSGSEVSVRFINDLYNPEAGIDRNLIVDRVRVGDRTLETESPEVFSTGTWRPDIGFQDGNPQSETLHSNGEFRFFDPPPLDFDFRFGSFEFRQNDAITVTPDPIGFPFQTLSITPGSGDGVIFSDFDITAGQTLRLIGFVNRLSADSGPAFLGVDYYDADGNEIGEQVFSIGISENQSSGVGTVELTAPAGTTSGGLYVVITDQANPAVVELRTLLLRTL